MTDLDRLIEAVEGEERGGSVWLDLALGPINGDRGLRAYRGSLDAALSLKEALLPGWEWVVGSNGEEARAVVGGEGKRDVEVDHIIPARALLLAVLKAYRETRG